jgi:adenylate cyclase
MPKNFPMSKLKRLRSFSLFNFRSIRTRIVTNTTILIVVLMTIVVGTWAANESQVYSEQQREKARALALLLSNSFSNEIADQNWSQIRLGVERLLLENDDFVYILASAPQLDRRIVAATPSEFQEQYVPDVVPVSVTDAALATSCSKDERCNLTVTDTFILRDIEFPKGQVRAKRGERIVEVAIGTPTGDDKVLGLFRIGISLRKVDRAVEMAIQKALLIGIIGLCFGLMLAYILAHKLSKPVISLQKSAEKIAAGDLNYRVDISLSDEIGALALSFNKMSATLQASFSQLQKTLESFERFVPNKFLLTIAPDGMENIQVGVASKRHLTILFSDIRSYTSLSESMTPLETFSFLNQYLAFMGLAIDNSGGFIDKYIGDAIMALFDDDTSDCALYAALSMRQLLAEFNRERDRKGLPPIEIGIGIHRGEVIMGTVGFSSRIDSTVIGDAVNVASRVEGLTKNYGCPILVTSDTIAALQHPEQFHLRLVDKSVKVKGKDEAIAIYELVESAKIGFPGNQ